MFLDDVKGIWFGGNIKRKNGKPIYIQGHTQGHTKEDINFIKHENNLLNLPPKKPKCPFEPVSDISTNTHITTNTVNYSGALQAHRTHTSQSISVIDPEGTATTTTTTSQTVTAMVETRFQTIELEIKHQREHQISMDQRLHHLESKTTSIDKNVASMMAFWKITPKHKRKALNNNNLDIAQPMSTEEDQGSAHSFVALNQGQRDTPTCS